MSSTAVRRHGGDLELRGRVASARERVRPHLSPEVVALLLIAAAVLLANLPALLGFVDLDPLNDRAELSSRLVRGLLSGRPTIDPSNGFNAQALGHLAAYDLLHLHWPWWNPYEGTGMPLLGETQSAAWFIPTLFTALANGQLYEHVVLEFVAGICTYRVLLGVGVDRAAALAGAIAFALCGKFAWFSDATVNPLAFLPMLLLGIERAFAAARDQRRGGWRLIALAVAFTAYAGFPEVAYADLMLAVAWVLWRVGCLPRARWAAFARRLVLGSAIGVMLAAPMLLAMAGYLSHADLASHTGTLLGSRHLRADQLPQLLMPYVYGPLNDAHHEWVWMRVGGYLTALVVLFALVGLLNGRRRGLKAVLLVWELLVIGHMYGAPGLGQVLGALPEVSRIEFYRYATASLEMGAIMLAALGLDDLIHGRADRRRVAIAVVLTVGAIAAATVAARPVVHSLQGSVPHLEDFYEASVAWAAGSVLVAGALALVTRGRLRTAALVAVLAVDAIAMFAVPQFSAPRRVTLDLAPVTYLRDHLGTARFFTLGPIQPNYGSYFHLASLRVEDFPPKNYVRFYHRHVDPFDAFVGFQSPAAPSTRHELLTHLAGVRAAGVRYVLTRSRPLPPDRRAYRLVWRGPTALIYRLRHAAPLMSARGCRITDRQIDSVRLDCRRATTLVRRETWFAGWSAHVGHRSVTIRRRDGVFQSVRVPRGRETVTFAFVPVGMRWALLALLAGLVAVLIPLRAGWDRLAGRLGRSSPTA